jgi:hypothetical protein
MGHQPPKANQCPAALQKTLLASNFASAPVPYMAGDKRPALRLFSGIGAMIASHFKIHPLLNRLY